MSLNVAGMFKNGAAEKQAAGVWIDVEVKISQPSPRMIFEGVYLPASPQPHPSWFLFLLFYNQGENLWNDSLQTSLHIHNSKQVHVEKCAEGL